MDYSKLQELMDIQYSQETKRDLNKEQRRLYSNTLLENLKEGGLTSEAIHYISAMAFQGGLNAFISWIRTLDADMQTEVMHTFLTAPVVKNMAVVRRYKIVLTLLAATLSDSNRNKVVEGQLFHWLVELSYKKDGTRITELSNAFKNCFVNRLGIAAKLPDLMKYQFSEEYTRSLICLLEEAVCGMQVKKDEDITKRNRMMKWVKDNEARFKLYTSKISDENMNQKAEENKESGNGKAEEKKEVSDKQTSETADKEVKPMGKTATKIAEIALLVDKIEADADELAGKLSDKEKQISSLKMKLSSERAVRVELEKESAELRNKLTDSEERCRVVSAEKKELEDRVLRQASVLDVFQEDKANSKSEQLNSIASSLIKYYKDFEMAQMMEMSTELEITLMDLLEDIFRKLEKCGVDIKGRLS